MRRSLVLFVAVLAVAMSVLGAGLSAGHAGPHGCYRSHGCH
jgi:hypothetical protein